MRNGEPKNISRPFSSEQALLTGIDQLLLTFAEDKLCERSVLGGRSDPRYSMIGEWRALTLQRGSVTDKSASIRRKFRSARYPSLTGLRIRRNIHKPGESSQASIFQARAFPYSASKRPHAFSACGSL